MPDWAQIRGEYPALSRWTFLNSATFGQLSGRTTAAMTAHLEHRDDMACADFLTWFADHDGLRAKIARLIHAEPEDIAFVPNASTALGILAAGIGWREGDEIVRLEGEFPNNIYAPAFLTRKGVRVVETRWEEMPGSLGPSTRLVLLSTVNYTSGFRAPLGELATECRRRGIVLYLDGTQSVGALEFDFSRIQPDMLAVNCYKWMLAPNGAAFMSVHSRLREKLEPLTVGWRSHRDWRNVDHLHLGAPEFVQSAEKYEGGMLPSLALYGLEASVDLMLELGPATIESRVLELARETRERVRGLGGEPLPFEDSAIIAARFEGRDASALARMLKERRVLVSARHGLLRISTHFYNDSADIDRFAEELSKLV